MRISPLKTAFYPTTPWKIPFIWKKMLFEIVLCQNQKSMKLEMNLTQTFSFEEKYEEAEVLNFQNSTTALNFCQDTDGAILENKDFQYKVVVPAGVKKSDKAILLLHGLNERSWDKYTPWADYLCTATGIPVIMFPIAFHMNRTPSSWYNPRSIMPSLDQRKLEITGLENASFFNLALSSRLSASPLRFYISGRESLLNIVQLFKEIRNGEHPLFKEDTAINVFAYSIGALLSQVMILSNPENLFDNTKWFFFCGGSLFEKMNGNSKEIMDQEAYNKIYNFYIDGFNFIGDKIEEAFQSMVRIDNNKEKREGIFSNLREKIRAITLKKDIVIPTLGALNAFGSQSCQKIVTEMDFPFEYTHQNPFPANKKIAPELLSGAFIQVFSQASAFLG